MKREETGKLIYDFDRASYCEVCIEDNWCRSTAREFRSFDGKRRLNGELYEGPVYYFKTNDLVKSLSCKENLIYSPEVEYLQSSVRVGEKF